MGIMVTSTGRIEREENLVDFIRTASQMRCAACAGSVSQGKKKKHPQNPSVIPQTHIFKRSGWLFLFYFVSINQIYTQHKL